MALHRACEASRRLAEIPGIGPVVATALVAEIGDWNTFSSGRSLAAWIGLVPKQHTTGGKDRLGSITKQGNRYLRWLLVVGAMAVICRSWPAYCVASRRRDLNPATALLSPLARAHRASERTGRGK
jgi:transposase